MDREQHITQDAAEHYATFVMARTAEVLGVAAGAHSEQIWNVFTDYLSARNWSLPDFEEHYPQYKINVDAQVPHFVERLATRFPGSALEFAIDEARFRVQGLKADLTVSVNPPGVKRYVSLKNYVGGGGIQRPQVSSGTFLSFACGFVFERSGVGRYVDPRDGSSFAGSSRTDREAVLRHGGRPAFIAPLQQLDDLQQYVRSELLTIRFHDEDKVREVIAHIVPLGQRAMLDVFELLGYDVVREKFLQRAGLDGTEDVLFFDEVNFVDSITNPRYDALRAAVNDRATAFSIQPVGQSLRFQFTREDATRVLAVDVPLTVNTNGAWHRPRVRYIGTQEKNDKGRIVHLEWGEIRPRKSREIATSTNTYVNLKATGIFDA